MTNKIKFNYAIAIFLFLITANCGFKIIDKTNINNYNIKDIVTTGDIRISYKIKNNLLINSKKESNNNLIINIETKKKKEIKEKNIKNEIVKYQIKIIANLEVNFINKGQKFKINQSAEGEYSVESTYSTTLTNEKKLIESLTEDISDKIQNKLNLLINDN